MSFRSKNVLLASAVGVGVLWPAPSMAASWSESPLSVVALLSTLSLLPFLLVMLTSFIKIAVVLSILRSAVGTPQVPPAMVINGLALILTAYVMAPTGHQIYDAIKPELAQLERAQGEVAVGALLNGFSAGREPLRRFLLKHSQEKDRKMFADIANRMQRTPKGNNSAPTGGGTKAERKGSRADGSGSKADGSGSKADGKGSTADRKGSKADRRASTVSRSDFLVLMPAFAIGQLTSAFQIGFMIFLPFLVIDMVVANILLALGMHMLSPTTISLPFKLLLFVLVDGWHLLARGLVLSYA